MKPLRLLAVADSDSYLKWAAWTLAHLRRELGAPETSADVVVIRSPLAPSDAQAAAAVAGTALDAPPVVSLRDLARRVRTERPDVVLVAATGPVAELVARSVVRASATPRPALVTGLPGMALPATERGTGWRRWADAFVVHAPLEVAPYEQALARHGAQTQVVLSRLPFLAGLEDAGSLPGQDPSVPPHRVVLAAQAKVPATRTDRVGLLDGMARLAAEGLDVVIKLRARDGERQTHNEPYPLDALWAAEHHGLGHRADAVTFATGPLSEHLVPGSALLTVSSTAGLESLAAGLPTVFLTDFGVGEAQLNESYVGSGCLRRLDEVTATLRSGGPTPDATWSARGYLHRHDELPGAVQTLADRARAGALMPRGDVVPWTWRRYAWSAARSALPVAVSARLTR